MKGRIRLYINDKVVIEMYYGWPSERLRIMNRLYFDYALNSKNYYYDILPPEHKKLTKQINNEYLLRTNES